MRDEASQQGAEAAEPEQERGEQDSEPATADGASVWKQMREEVLQNAPEEANLQAEGTAETEHGKGEKEVEPTETESAS